MLLASRFVRKSKTGFERRTSGRSVFWGDFLMGRTVAVILPGILLLAACSEGSRESAPETVRDSAGVRIVELPSVSTIDARFAMSDSPVYRVGWKEDEHEFDDIVAGGLWPDGRAVVGDGGTPRQIVILSATGAVDAVLGGPGQGPGEFSAIFAVLPVGGDTVVAQDHFAMRATTFDGRDVVGTVDLRPILHKLLGMDGAGNFLMGPPLARLPSPTRAYAWLSVPLLRFNPATADGDTLAWVDWGQGTLAGGSSPFASGGWATVRNGAFVTGRGDRPELRWHDSTGGIRQITRWRDEPQPVPDDMISAWEAAQRAWFEERGLPQSEIESRILRSKEAIREPLPFFGAAGSLPGLFGGSGLVSDPDGNVWIASFLAPGDRSQRRYHVMSAEGRWLGLAEMPGDLRVLAIGRDHVLGVERNAFDIQAIALYALQRPREQP